MAFAAAIGQAVPSGGSKFVWHAQWAGRFGVALNKAKSPHSFLRDLERLWLLSNSSQPAVRAAVPPFYGMLNGVAVASWAASPPGGVADVGRMAMPTSGGGCCPTRPSSCLRCWLCRSLRARRRLGVSDGLDGVGDAPKSAGAVALTSGACPPPPTRAVGLRAAAALAPRAGSGARRVRPARRGGLGWPRRVAAGVAAAALRLQRGAGACGRQLVGALP